MRKRKREKEREREREREREITSSDAKSGSQVFHRSHIVAYQVALTLSEIFSPDSSTSPFTFNLGRCTSGASDIPHRLRDAQPFPHGRSPFQPFLRRWRVERPDEILIKGKTDPDGSFKRQYKSSQNAADARHFYTSYR